MASIFLDLAGTSVCTAGNTYGTAVSSTAGLTTVDMVDDVGNMISAIWTTSAVSGSGNVTVKIQESSDDVSWSDISGATFTASTAANTLQLISFQITKRYVRGYGTLNSGTSITGQLTFIAARNPTPSGKGGWVNETGGS